MKNKDFSRSAFSDLDQIVRIVPGDVIVVGGRQSMGKSSFLQDMAIEWASQGKEITYLDFQMTSEERNKHIMASHAEVEFRKIPYVLEDPTPDLTQAEYLRLVSSRKEIMSWNIKIVPYSREHKNNKPYDIYEFLSGDEMPDVLIIDSIQMIMFSKEMAVEIHVLMNLLKRKAMETGMVVLIASQISRNVELRQGKRPIPSDLSDSSSLEEVSDKVFFLLRREYYDALDKPGQAELIVAKNRNGPGGVINLTFRKEIAQFANWAPFSYYINEEASKENEEAFAAFTPT